MSANEAISYASVREFLVSNNGKVKNIDLVHHFRQQLSDPVNRSKFNNFVAFSFAEHISCKLSYSVTLFITWKYFLLDSVRGKFKEIVHTISTVQTIDVSVLTLQSFFYQLSIIT